MRAPQPLIAKLLLDEATNSIGLREGLQMVRFESPHSYVSTDKNNKFKSMFRNKRYVPTSRSDVNR